MFAIRLSSVFRLCANYSTSKIIRNQNSCLRIIHYISNMSLSVNCSTCPSSVISPTVFVDPNSKTCTVSYSAVCAPYTVLSNFPRAPYSGCSSHLLYCDKYQPFSTLRNVRSAYTCPPYTSSTYRC